MLVWLSACSGEALWVGTASSASGIVGVNQETPDEKLCPDEASLRLSDETCWPTRHVGTWRGIVASNPTYLSTAGSSMDYPLAQPIITIAADASGQWHFGPLAEDTPSSPDSSPVPSANSVLLEGIVYSLSDVRMSGAARRDRQDDPNLSFELYFAISQEAECDLATTLVAPAAPCISDDCEMDTPICDRPSGRLGISLRLSADGLSMRGTAQSDAQGASEVADIEFVRL